MSGEDATVRVVVADDQRVVREGLVTSLSVLPGVEIGRDVKSHVVSGHVVWRFHC
jgi:DNA-binding NarL/FixJ family response regulator